MSVKKLYSVEWDCEDYWTIHMVCVAESREESVVKFKKKFDGYKKEAMRADLHFFTDLGYDGKPLSEEIKEIDVDDVDVFSHEE